MRNAIRTENRYIFFARRDTRSEKRKVAFLSHASQEEIRMEQHKHNDQNRKNDTAQNRKSNSDRNCKSNREQNRKSNQEQNRKDSNDLF